ncbi:hypothetical protein [Alkalihalobacillus sp. CinArs1]|uniref:hypothetical protein n=1 Tax=Alkalihalobacillus sp. CinArs1 TaxID=2995314 RepID=UPI0022DE12D5|nr:hypothetical protein [Alkalihalobacillus sp. CinArs1]
MEHAKVMFSILSLLIAATFAALYIYIFSLHTEMEGSKASATEVSAASFPTEYQFVEDFVSDFHAFYNRTTGYGMIERVEMEDQEKHAEAVTAYINIFLENGVEHHDLKVDLQAIKMIASSELDEADVRLLHRYFHDLDKAMNGYDHPDTFGVTETFGGEYNHE